MKARERSRIIRRLLSLGRKIAKAHGFNFRSLSEGKDSRFYGECDEKNNIKISLLSSKKRLYSHKTLLGTLYHELVHAGYGYAYHRRDFRKRLTEISRYASTLREKEKFVLWLRKTFRKK